MLRIPMKISSSNSRKGRIPPFVYLTTSTYCVDLHQVCYVGNNLEEKTLTSDDKMFVGEVSVDEMFISNIFVDYVFVVENRVG